MGWLNLTNYSLPFTSDKAWGVGWHACAFCILIQIDRIMCVCVCVCVCVRACVCADQWRLLVFQGGGAHFQPTFYIFSLCSSYKLSIYLYVNSALCSFSRKCSVTLSYQLAVLSSELTSVLSIASQSTVCKAEALHCPTPCL